MLIEFSVENFRSIRKKQTLSLVASNLTENNAPKNGIFPIGNISLLNTSFIYGANASGKSNLIRALKVMEAIILKSAFIENDKLPIVPFLLNEQSAKQTTEFEIIFIENKIKYQYGFSATKERIYDEWLYAYPKGKAQLWFEREYLTELNETSWEYGANFKGNKKVWENATRDDALFLSTAIQLNSETLKPIYNWFRKKLTIRLSNIGNLYYSKKYCESVENKLEILNFMKAADLGIEDFSLEEEKKIISLPDDIPPRLKEVISWDHNNKVLTVHQSNLGNNVRFDLKEDESEGTQRMFALSALFLSSFKLGGVIFIDELDCSLHPQIMHFIIQQFCNPEINTANAQLIFTTHDVSLLSESGIRRDQIWFINKNKKQETKLYPLTEFHIRKDMKFEKAYLSGRFGAIPNISFEYVKEENKKED